MAGKFSVVLHSAPHEPSPRVNFLTYVPRTLSVDEAKQLIAEIQGVLPKEPEQSAKPETAE